MIPPVLLWLPPDSVLILCLSFSFGLPLSCAFITIPCARSVPCPNMSPGMNYNNNMSGSNMPPTSMGGGGGGPHHHNNHPGTNNAGGGGHNNNSNASSIHNSNNKEPNLMPVPSPQQIQYLNQFEGQELTIQKQPNSQPPSGVGGGNNSNNMGGNNMMGLMDQSQHPSDVASQMW